MSQLAPVSWVHILVQQVLTILQGQITNENLIVSLSQEPDYSLWNIHHHWLVSNNKLLLVMTHGKCREHPCCRSFIHAYVRSYSCTTCRLWFHHQASYFFSETSKWARSTFAAKNDLKKYHLLHTIFSFPSAGRWLEICEVGHYITKRSWRSFIVSKPFQQYYSLSFHPTSSQKLWIIFVPKSRSCKLLQKLKIF